MKNAIRTTSTRCENCPCQTNCGCSLGGCTCPRRSELRAGDLVTNRAAVTAR